MLTSAIITNTVSPTNQSRIEEALSTLLPNSERAVYSRVFVMFAIFIRCLVLRVAI